MGNEENYDSEDVIRMITSATSEINLRKYQLKVCEIMVAVLNMQLAMNKIPLTDTDKQIMEMYDKVMNSRNVEQAEAHFIGLADKFCNSLGLGDFDSLKSKFDSGMNPFTDQGDF